MKSEHGHSHRPGRPRRRLPRSFKDLTPSKAFSPRTFFYEMVWKVLLTRREGQHKMPAFPKRNAGQAALTWIGHASFLIQFNDLNDLTHPHLPNRSVLTTQFNAAGPKSKHLP